MSSSASENTTTPGKSPAFQFYANDFLSDANVVVMSLQERGAYITLICYCWQQGGLPNDVAYLARLCGVPVTAFRRFWPAVERCFRATDDGRLAHPKLDRIRQDQNDYRRRQSDASRKRWDKPQPSTGNPTASERDIPPSSRRESSSSSSSIFDLRKKEKQASPSADDVLSERAGRFLERYQALYTKHRHGAHYLLRPHLDFPKAKELCAVWPDERLDKLATVFLLTDHKFAEEGSRTIGQFAALASWCDGRLAEAGIA